MEILETEKNAKKCRFFCNFCGFRCIKKSNWENHVQTKKHSHRHNGNEMETKKCQNGKKMPDDNRKNNMIIEQKYNCKCGKIYISKSGLWKHNKKCSEKIDETKEMMKYLIKENSEFKQMIMEVIKNGTHHTINNNSNNKIFNLQFFLNETCKDAMNIMDFVDSIKLQICDLENVGKLGYVEGISNIIIKNLNNLDIVKRPVHCTDSKREVLYVKDENKWHNDSKEDNNKKIKKAIKYVAHKNTHLLIDFKEKYPDCIYSDSKSSDQYNKIIIESFDSSDENENKIIKNIAKQVVVDK